MFIHIGQIEHGLCAVVFVRCNAVMCGCCLIVFFSPVAIVIVISNFYPSECIAW